MSKPLSKNWSKVLDKIRFEERRRGLDVWLSKEGAAHGDGNKLYVLQHCILLDACCDPQAPNSGFLDDLQAVRGPVRRLERRSMPRKHGNKSIATAYYTAPDNAEISAL